MMHHMQGPIKKISLLFLVIILSATISITIKAKLNNNQNLNSVNERSWTDDLNYLNYLILKASSLNVINGLSFNKEQVLKLKKLSGEIESLKPLTLFSKKSNYEDINNIRDCFIELINNLEGKKPIPDKLKNRVLLLRSLESEIIKKTLLGAEKNEYLGNNCLKCHSTPDYFPEGNISNMQTKTFTHDKRREIDIAHVKGIFGDRGIKKLWELKEEVDDILYNAQKYILKDFRCCLLPPDGLMNIEYFGQAFVTDEWFNYFKEARSIDDKNWKNYKNLFIYPIEDIIESTLPGIKLKDKMNILKKVNKILEESRNMDDIDFEIKKKDLCIKLKDALNIDFLIGENDRTKEDRQFITAMFLLYPGNLKIYDSMLDEFNKIE